MLEAQERGQTSEQIDSVQASLFLSWGPWLILGIKFSENIDKGGHTVCSLACISPIPEILLPCAIHITEHPRIFLKLAVDNEHAHLLVNTWNIYFKSFHRLNPKLSVMDNLTPSLTRNKKPV